jgi:hypothetical protein
VLDLREFAGAVQAREFGHDATGVIDFDGYFHASFGVTTVKKNRPAKNQIT